MSPRFSRTLRRSGFSTQSLIFSRNAVCSDALSHCRRFSALCKGRVAKSAACCACSETTRRKNSLSRSAKQLITLQDDLGTSSSSSLLCLLTLPFFSKNRKESKSERSCKYQLTSIRSQPSTPYARLSSQPQRRHRSPRPFAPPFSTSWAHSINQRSISFPFPRRRLPRRSVTRASARSARLSQPTTSPSITRSTVQRLGEAESCRLLPRASAT